MALKAEVDEILGRFESAWSLDTRDLERPSADEVLRRMIGEKSEAHRARLTEEFFGCGPLHELITRDVQEILVNGADEIFFEQDGALKKLEDQFLSEVTFKNFIDRVCAQAEIKVDLAHPFADGRWRDFRVHLGCAPLTHCAYHLSLRKLPDNPWTLEKLRARDWCTAEQAEVLGRLLVERKNLIVLGPTGCGKTSVLGALLKGCAEDERVVILEDTSELPRPNAASTKLLTRPATGGSTLNEITLTDLVRQSLRMRPHRLVLGEVRGGEAKDLLLALATGHGGSFGTLHATDARQALLRLEMLVQLGAPQWSVQTVRQLIHLSVDALVVCGFKNGKRALLDIQRVAALETFGFLLEPLI